MKHSMQVLYVIINNHGLNPLLPDDALRHHPFNSGCGIIWSPPDRHNGNGDIASSIPKLPYRLFC